tara:strand:+ start:108 stop:1109 length:1002 start_codon:yes stop_codon:yes gene_type:complete
MFNNSVSPLPELVTKKIPVRPAGARAPRMPAPVRSGNPFPTTTRKLKQTSGGLVPTKKIRTLKGNERLDAKLKQLVDKMTELKPYHYQMVTLRSSLTNQSSVPRRFLKSLGADPDKKTLVEATTNLGTINMSQIYSFGMTIASHEAVLKDMGIDEDTIEDEWYDKHQLIVETSHLTMTSLWQIEPLNKQLQDYLDNFVLYEREKYTDEEFQVIRYVVCRQKQKQDLTKKAAKYVRNYNKLKQLFASHSTTGNFPRRWDYKGVGLGWEKCSTRIGTYQKALWYFNERDQKEGTKLAKTYNEGLKNYNYKVKKTTFRFCIDDFDYVMPENLVVAI